MRSKPKTGARDSHPFIDVNQLIAGASIEELNRRAEEYFAQTRDWSFHLAKPFGAIDEAPQLLINFAVVLQGLAVRKGQTVLEFGAGTCWASRFLTQLGCKVIAVDISATALRIGKELYQRNPVFGKVPEPEFLLFDGHRIDVPDESIDRVMCLHAYHHVPNAAAVLAEFSRVLKEGGIAGFAEPGPDHSRSPQSQDEMRTFGVIENDVDIHKIWRQAHELGFTDMKLAIFNVAPFLVSLSEFEKFLSGGSVTRKFTESTQVFLKDQRTFFLFKGEESIIDSRSPSHLKARIITEPDILVVPEGTDIVLPTRVENNSNAMWLPLSAGVGAVQIGCHVLDKQGKSLYPSYHWEALFEGEGRPVMPGDVVSVKVTMPPLTPGRYILEFDMVSNDVAWFAQNGSATVRVSLEVVPAR